MPPYPAHRARGGALVGAVCAAALVGAWPSSPGVWLEPAERAGLAAAAAAFGGLTGGLGVRGGLAGAALAGPALLAGIALLPAVGRLWERVAPVHALLVVLAWAAGLWALRGRARPVALVAGAAAVVAAVARAPDSPRVGRAPPGPDLVLLTLDTTRADHLSAAGGPAPTPALDAFRASARWFDAAFSPAVLTGPAHAAALSGAEPARLGLRANGQRLGAALPWVPAELAAAGFETGAFVSAAVLDARLGFSRGFSAFDAPSDARLVAGHGLLRARGLRHRSGSAFARPGAETVARALRWWRHHEGARRFLWVHLYEPHWPYTPDAAAAAAAGLSDATPHGVPSALRGRPWSAEERARGRALYAAEVHALDARVGALLAGVGPGAVVVVAGDHGESLGENGVDFGHGTDAGAPEAWIPLGVRAPALPPGRVAAPVSLRAVADTLRVSAGLPAHGPGLLGAFDGPPASPVWTRAFSSGPRGSTLRAVAARQGTGSLVWRASGPSGGTDRGADPLERALQPADLGALLPALTAADGPAPAVDPALAPALEALGYREPSASGVSAPSSAYR